MPRLKSQALLDGILRDYYTGLTSPVAWCSSAGPAEILRALGFNVYFPENHAAILGAKRLTERYIPRAHQAGYDSEICSYLTSDIGAWLLRESPLTVAYGLPSIPEPDLIVYNTNQCREVPNGSTILAGNSTARWWACSLPGTWKRSARPILITWWSSWKS